MPSTSLPSPSIDRLATDFSKPHTATPHRGKRQPLNTWPAFVAAHRDTGAFFEYLRKGRKGSIQLSQTILSELEPDAALFLHANNHEARIAFAAVAMRQLKAFMGERETKFFWVTFIPGKFVVPEGKAADFDPRRVQGWAHEALSGFAHLGMVEVAYYTNVSALLGGHERGASWHSHHLVWGCEKATLQRRVKTLNARSKAFLPGVKPAFAVELRPGEVIGKLLYMLKFPQSNYRCFPDKAERFDANTRKMVSEPTGFFRQRKGELRPGEKARVCRMLEDAYLDRLAFAGGEGVPLLAAIRKDALLPYRREQSRLASRTAFSQARR